VLAAPLFTVRWRWAAGRALALLRFQGGKKIAPQIQRMRGKTCWQPFSAGAGLPGKYRRRYLIPDHPLVRETMKDVLTEALDIEA